MVEHSAFQSLVLKLTQRPHAWARVSGSEKYPHLSGTVYFYQTRCGVLVAAEITGLPETKERGNGIFGFHIHSGAQCSGTRADPFADVLTHYDPKGNPHPYHAGDLPPLFGNHGHAFQVFLTDRFSVDEVLHKTVIIHSAPDDFTSQPGGNAGEKIACGQIEACCGC